jgi:hypothetical protein
MGREINGGIVLDESAHSVKGLAGLTLRSACTAFIVAVLMHLSMP